MTVFYELAMCVVIHFPQIVMYFNFFFLPSSVHDVCTFSPFSEVAILAAFNVLIISSTMVRLLTHRLTKNAFHRHKYLPVGSCQFHD